MGLYSTCGDLEAFPRSYLTGMLKYQTEGLSAINAVSVMLDFVFLYDSWTYYSITENNVIF